ncbi:hypothetical protein BO94DRAFT_534972 [Aspergillus sclerotioniger CBS 115572]|uniref:Rhodopsin domain-containing protein n=1 Tax=Aspergillus sclerotioniger CBS 115572 TaxID=1450535 RepID=A0A317WS61_9EURO|nr:hypothetical protein BO94DRAFT_534972 [Aspergillus sclerotioniger CBS 115572]PWY87967.1 hypothetical protein BO94DRAFT_534972 [Aspergillus sclerotioniger CBS 115572]
MQKAFLAMEVFYMLTLTLGKLSVMVLFYSLLSSTGRSGPVLVAMGVLLAWTLAMIFVICFQCHLPDVWNLTEGTCLDLTAVWAFVGAANILVEIVIVLVPSVIIARVQMSLKKRLVVIGCFSVRIMDIAVTSTQLHYVNAFGRAPLPLNIWEWVMCSQVLQTVTILTACVPYLREFLEAFPSGMFQPLEGGQKVTRQTYDGNKSMDSDVELVMRDESASKTSQKA